MKLATITEYGVRFETGVPVDVRYVRNTRSAPKIKKLSDEFQQRIEPAGRYMLHHPTSEDLAPGWEKGVVHFKSPLVIEFNLEPDNYYDEGSWKRQLERHYKKRGRGLSRAIVADGHDAVVTVRDKDTREIVDLTWLIS